MKIREQTAYQANAKEERMSSRIHRRRAITLTEVLVVIAIIGVMMGMLLPAVQMVRESGRKTSCSNNLAQIGKGMQVHSVQWEILPNAGDDWLSPRSLGPVDQAGRSNPQPAKLQAWGWAYQLLPYIEQEPLWQDANPALVASIVVKQYNCPTRGKSLERPGIQCGLQPGLRAPLHFAGNGGNGIAIIGGPIVRFPDPNSWLNQNGAIIPRADRDRVAHGNIKDGQAYTLLVGERNVNMRRRYDSTQQDEDNGYIAGYSWDTIRWGYETPYPDRQDLSDFDTRFGSSHTGVTQFVLCDGSVKSITYSIDLLIFQQLCARDDGRSPEIP